MPRPVEVTPAALADLPLPHHDDDASKHDRGSVLVAGGCAETPGAVLLAGLAAMRAGAGRLRLAVAPEVAMPLAIAVPEARVVGTDDPAHDCSGLAAVLYGPGVLDVDAAEAVVDAFTSSMPEGVLVLDAGALPAVGRHPEWTRRLEGRCLLTPNPSELEALGVDDVRTAAERFGCVVSARGAETVVATPDGRCWVDRHGTVGLATSGSGDVAAGLAVGFAARGADPATAAVWAAAVHGLAGERLGGPGFLAREILDEVPSVVAELLA